MVKACVPVRITGQVNVMAQTIVEAPAVAQTTVPESVEVPIMLVGGVV